MLAVLRFKNGGRSEEGYRFYRLYIPKLWFLSEEAFELFLRMLVGCPPTLDVHGYSLRYEACICSPKTRP